MRAALCRSYGPPEVVRTEEVASPELVPGQVRVRVRAAAVNYPDVLLVANTYQLTAPLPFIPGTEFAGVIAEIADDVSEVDVGTPVSGSVVVGAFAEEVVVPAGAITRIPDGVDMRSAAAYGVAHRTAYHALRTIARLQGGEQLVVLGAGGGVGLAAVQLGVVLGATVTAVASSADKLAVAERYGARHLVDRRLPDLRAELRKVLPDGADVVVDPVGGGAAEPALRCLHWGGRFITVGYATGEIPRIPLNLVLLKGVRVMGFQLLDVIAHAPSDHRIAERELAELLATGRVRPHIGATYRLDDAAAALRCMADGRAVGKLVIDVA